jgi:hypothetical protein
VLDGVGTAQLLADLPNQIVAASLAVRQDGALFIAFTRAASENLIGAQSDLMVAYQTCDGDCTWRTHLLRDGYGRSLRAERAVVTLDAQERATIVFRGLGFGPDAQGNLMLYPQDPPGMVQQTGELAQVYFDPASPSVAPTYWTQDGAINWQPAALFDTHTDNTLVMAVNVPALGPLRASVSQVAQQTITGAPLVFGAAPPMPDFALTGGEVDSPYTTGKVTVTVENRGTAWAGSAEAPLQIIATWDGGPGVGLPAGSVALTEMDAAALQVVLPLDPSISLEQPRQLILTVNPGQIIPEANGDNNSLSLTLGGFGAPSGITSAGVTGKGLVLLGWEESTDERVAGYRIYRATGAGELLPLGSTPVAGYADVTAETGKSYRYAVTAYGASGAESAYGEDEIVEVTIGEAQSIFYLPRVMR